MMRAFLICAVLLGGFFVSPAYAQQVCGPRNEIIARLFRNHDEVKNVQGVLITGNAIVEVFSRQSPGERGRSFTIITSYPDGSACVVLAGHYWRYVTDRGI